MENNTVKSILLVEDDKFISTALTRRLEDKGYTVYQVYDGAAVERMTIRHVPDCIILDIGLPKTSGYEVFHGLKKFYKGPIIFLTSQSTDQAEITCLRLGADDFITKKTNFNVFYERIKRAINNYINVTDIAHNNMNTINLGEFAFDKKNFQCKYHNKNITLTSVESELLYYMLINKDKLITRDELYRSIKGITYNGTSRAIDVNISRLKVKLIVAGAHSKVISSIRGKGYILVSTSLINTSIREKSDGSISRLQVNFP